MTQTQTMLVVLLGRVKTVILGSVLAAYSISALSACVNHSPNERSHNDCVVRSMNNATLSQGDYDAIVTRLQMSGNMLADKSFADFPSSIKFRLTPIAKWDSSANGGEPNKPLTIGALTFIGDPSLHEKSALLIGLGSSVAARKVIGDQSFLDLKAYGNVNQSLKHSFNVNEYGYSVCGAFGLANSVHFDQCYSQSSIKKELSSSHQYITKQSLTLIAPKEVGQVELSRESLKSNSLVVIKDAVAYIHDSPNSVFFRVELFNKKPLNTLEIIPSTGQELSIYTDLFNKNSYLKLSNESFSTYPLLGYPINRYLIGVVVGLELIPKNYIELSTNIQRSNVNYYSSTSASISWRFIN